MLRFSKYWASGYVDLHHIRNIYLISNTLGAHKSMGVNGEWGVLKKKELAEQTAWNLESREP